MRDVTPIRRRVDTPESRAFWANIEKVAERAKHLPEWQTGKRPGPVPRYGLNDDKLVVKHRGLRTRIASLLDKYKKLTARATEIWKKQDALLKQMQNKCKHEYVLEQKTSWRDEYDSWHDGYPERKCIDCFLVEKSDRNGYQKLAKSTVIEIIETKGDRIFSLEFEDLNP